MWHGNEVREGFYLEHFAILVESVAGQELKTCSLHSTHRDPEAAP